MMKCSFKNLLRGAFGMAVLAGGLAAWSVGATDTRRPAPKLLPSTEAAPAPQGSPGKEIVFNYFPNSREVSANMVMDLWLKDPEYKDYVGTDRRIPSFILGMADVNGDGKPELFAQHSDEDYGVFCKPAACRLHIYVVQPTGLIEIGRIWGRLPFYVSSEKTNGINNLTITGANLKKQTYVWNGKTYQPK